MKLKDQTIKLLGLFTLVMLVSSCARNPVTGKKEVSFMSEQQEISMGQSYDPQISAMYGVYKDDKLQAFINEKGKQMAAISHRPNLPYEFKIMDSPVVNAFAVPGGYVYFTRGIMAHFNNEAEFAGVLGHEIGHITGRHTVKQQRNQMLMQIGLIAGMVVSPEFAQFGEQASQALGLLALKFGRDAESQSDILGVEYSTAIGYDAVEMADFFQTLTRLSEDRGQSIPTFLSTHPNPADRYGKVKQMARQKQAIYSGQKFAVNRDQYLRMIDGIVYGEDPRQGFVENNIFYHPDLKFAFRVPQGWKVVNSPSQVQMAPEGGKGLMTMQIAPGTDLNAAAQNFVQKQELTVLESSNTTVNGNPAVALLLENKPVQNPNGQQQQSQQKPLRILTYFIKYNNLIYQFNGVSTQQDFNAYFNSFRSTMKSFGTLTDPDKLNRKPEVVKIVSVKSKGTLQQALNSYNMPPARHKELAILNGMELEQQLHAGALFKIIGRQTMLGK